MENVRKHLTLIALAALLSIVLWQHGTITKLRAEARANDEAATQCESISGLVPNR